MTNPFVIVIAGPTGVGKTTVSKLLSKQIKCSYLCEDELTRELLPDIYTDVENYPDEFKFVENQIFLKAKEYFDHGSSVVIDRINLGKEFIEKIKKQFPERLILKVLFPDIETTIQRDKNRDGWTSGEAKIRQYYKLYEELKPIIGEDNYIDNSYLSPNEIVDKLRDNHKEFDLIKSQI